MARYCEENALRPNPTRRKLKVKWQANELEQTGFSIYEYLGVILDHTLTPK